MCCMGVPDSPNSPEARDPPMEQGLCRWPVSLGRAPREPPSYLVPLAGDAALAVLGDLDGPGGQEQEEDAGPEKGEPAVLGQPHGIQHGGIKGTGACAAVLSPGDRAGTVRSWPL